MNSLKLKTAEVHFNIDSLCPSRPVGAFEINIGRCYEMGFAYVSYCQSEADTEFDNRIFLEVRDRESFKIAYRAARCWGYGGLAVRLIR